MFFSVIWVFMFFANHHEPWYLLRISLGTLKRSLPIESNPYYILTRKYRHVLGLTIDYWHNSELHVITAPSLISTIHKLPQHPLSLSSLLCLHRPFSGNVFRRCLHSLTDRTAYGNWLLRLAGMSLKPHSLLFTGWLSPDWVAPFFSR
jgi:hypothetical protein